MQYTYNITDFVNNKVIPSKFIIELNGAGIGDSYLYMNTSSSKVDIFFDSTLSAGDKNILDSLVASHTDVEPTRGELGPTSDHIMGYPTGLEETPIAGHTLIFVEDDDGGHWDSKYVIQDFLDLTDTPTTYSGYDGMSVTVISGGTGLEFTDVSQLVTAAKVESFYAVSEELSSTTISSFRTKVDLDLSPQKAGYFEVNHSCLQSHADTGVYIKTRLRIDNTTNVQEINEELYNFKYEDDAWRMRSGVYVLYLAEGPHNIKLQYCTGEAGKAAYIKEAFISVKRLVLVE